ncbi:CPBP family intramembrane glutamic endopeptidase [Flavobacterium sp.]
MFLENTIVPRHKFWSYLGGSVIFIFAAFVGQIPLAIVAIGKSFSAGKGIPTDEKELMQLMDKNLSLFLILISFAFALFAIYLVSKYIHKQNFLSLTTARSKVDWKRIFFSFSLWGIFTVGSTLLMFYTAPENFVINFKWQPFIILFFISIVLIPIQTSTEEYIFRGYLMQGFASLARNKWFPLLMTSIIFGGMHIMNPEVRELGYTVMFYYIGTGLFLGIITLMDDGMELALGFHAANNLFAALLVTSDWSALQTDAVFKDISKPSAGIEVLIPLLIIFPLLLFIFSKKYRWNNWKEKLTGTIQVSTINLKSKNYE